MNKGNNENPTAKMPPVPPARTEKLTDEEKKIQEMMILHAAKFAEDPEYAICEKTGIGSCFEF